MQGKTVSFAANDKVSQSLERRFFFFFCLLLLFYFKSRATDTTLPQQNLCGKLLKICKKVMLIVGLNKNQVKLAT